MTANAVSVEVSAVERLTTEQRFDLDNVCASFAMERLEISDAEREIGAQFILDEITFDQALAALNARRG